MHGCGTAPSPAPTDEYGQLTATLIDFRLNAQYLRSGDRSQAPTLRRGGQAVAWGDRRSACEAVGPGASAP
jgi:hypothetical protein